MDKPDQLSILQQNINKSLISQLDFLVAARKTAFDICAIQEPYIDFRGKSRANHTWTTVYPSTHSTALDALRSLLLVNTDLDPNGWQQINIPHLDITAIEVKARDYTLRIFKLYP